MNQSRRETLYASILVVAVIVLIIVTFAAAVIVPARTRDRCFRVHMEGLRMEVALLMAQNGSYDSLYNTPPVRPSDSLWALENCFQGQVRP